MNKLKGILKSYQPSEAQLKLLEEFCELLWEENQKINLFSRKMPKNELAIHLFDSLIALEVISPLKIADLGSGGGFPAIPLAICLSSLESHHEFLLVESVKKKANFLQKAVKMLGLNKPDKVNITDDLSIEPIYDKSENSSSTPKIRVESERIEILAHKPQYREKFDFVTARALAPLPTLLEYASGFLKVGGQLLAWKSTDIEEEIEKSNQAVKELQMKEINRLNYQLPENKGERILICYQKYQKLGKKYPRGIGLPSKSPLLDL